LALSDVLTIQVFPGLEQPFAILRIAGQETKAIQGEGFGPTYTNVASVPSFHGLPMNPDEAHALTVKPIASAIALNGPSIV
jgi:hypothetical protein